MLVVYTALVMLCLPVSHMSSTAVLATWPTALVVWLIDADISERGWFLAAEDCRCGLVCCTSTDDWTWDSTGVFGVRLKRNFAPVVGPGVSEHRVSHRLKPWRGAVDWAVCLWSEWEILDLSCSFNGAVCTWCKESRSDKLPRELCGTELCTDASSRIETTDNATRLAPGVLTELQFLKEVTSSDSDCFCIGFVTKFLLWVLRVVESVEIPPLTQFVTVASVTVVSQSFALSSLILTDVGDPSETASVRR